MRGVAAMLVICYHVILYGTFTVVNTISSSLVRLVINGTLVILEAGYSGVYLFFMISAYVLTKKLESGDYNDNAGFNATKYYLRRIFRTWPLYFLTIPLFVVVGMTPLMWQSFLLIQNFFKSTFNNNPTWTLMVEEIFYLILPVWVVFFKKNWKLALSGAAILSGVYLFYMEFILGAVTGYYFAQFPAFAFTFALGIAVAYKKKIKVNWVILFAAWAAISFLFSSHFYKNSTAVFEILPILLFSGLYFFILGSLENSRLFTNRVSLFLGKLSYPIYLLSLPVEVVLIGVFGRQGVVIWVPATIIATITASYLINLFIEKRFIEFGRALEPRFDRNPVSVVAAPLEAAQLKQNTSNADSISENKNDEDKPQ